MQKAEKEATKQEREAGIYERAGWEREHIDGDGDMTEMKGGGGN